ncbi:MAG: SAM hydrolase/SAM-dependent halogenase family protein [Candidatus Binatia bacterium]
MTRGLITLTTDFGQADPYVGIMKGVIFTINPGAAVIDLSHNVPPQDVFCGALILNSAVQYFPQGAIHVGVVDPGVGSNRRPLLIEAEGCFYVGPDNGVLSLALREKKITRIINLNNQNYFLKPTSQTFHGRDIFAPVAAYLSRGTPAEDFGSKSDHFETLAWPHVALNDGFLEGEIIHIDRFGNLVTNIRAEDLQPFATAGLTISFKEYKLHGLERNYASGAEKALIALVDSWGVMEIAQFRGSAQAFSGAARGDKVLVHRIA